MALSRPISFKINQTIKQSTLLCTNPRYAVIRRSFVNIHHSNHPRASGYQPNNQPNALSTVRKRVETVIGPVRTAGRNTFVLACAIASLTGFAAIVYYLFLDASHAVHSQSFDQLHNHPKLTSLIGQPVIDVSENSRGYRSTSSRRWENGSKFVTVAYAVRGSHGSATLVCEMKRIRGKWVLNYAFADQYVRNKLRRVWLEDHRAQLMADEHRLANQG